MRIIRRIANFSLFRFGRTGLGVACRLWTQLLGLAVFLYAGNSLTLDDFGQFAMAASIVVFLNTLMYNGPYQYIIRAVSEQYVIHTAFWVNLLVSIILTILIVALTPVFSYIFQAPLLATIIILLSPSIILASVCAWIESIIIRRDRLTLYFCALSIAESIGAILTICFLGFGFGPQSLAMSRLASLCVLSSLYFFFMPIFPKLEVHRKVAVDLLIFSTGLYGTAVLGYLGRYSGDFLLSYYIAPVAAGLYRLGNRITEAACQVIYTPLEKIALSRLGEAHRLRGDVRDACLGLLLASAVISWGPLIVIGISTQDLVLTLLGEKWLSAAPIITILSFARITDIFRTILTSALTIKGMTRTVFMITLMNTTIVLGLLIATSRYGAVEAAMGQAIASGLMIAIFFWLAPMLLHLSWRDLAYVILKGFAAAIFVAVPTSIVSRIAHGFEFSPLLSLAMVALVGGSLWVFLCAVVFRQTIRRALG